MAVVGTGWWATEYHIPALLNYADCELVALVDPNVDKRRMVQENFNIPTGFASVEELCAEMQIDGAIVATPSARHYPVAKHLIESGVSVMVEKPFTTSASDAFALVEQAQRKGIQITVGYTFQHTAAARALKQIMLNGEIGEVLLVNGLFASMAEAYYRGEPEKYKDVLNWSLIGPDPQTFSDPTLAGGGQGHTYSLCIKSTGHKRCFLYE
jgi:predicted dehydrogenase